MYLLYDKTMIACNLPCAKAVDNWWFHHKNERVDKWMCCYLSCGMLVFCGSDDKCECMFLSFYPYMWGTFYLLFIIVSGHEWWPFHDWPVGWWMYMYARIDDWRWNLNAGVLFYSTITDEYFYFVGFWNKYCLIVSMYVDDSAGETRVVFMGNAWSDVSSYRFVDCWNESWSIDDCKES